MGVEPLYNSVEFESEWSCQLSSRQLEWRCGRESHTRPGGGRGNPDGVWGPEKMLIRCSKESKHPAEWALGPRLSSPIEQERHNVTVITVGSKYYSLCLVSSSLSHANPEQPFCTLTNKVRGKNIFLEKSFCVVDHCVGMYPAYICIFLHESADDNTTPVYSTLYSELRRGDE